MRKSLGQVEGFVGVDISESWLDVHLLPSGERARFSRDRRGIARLVRWLVGKGRLLVVVEATGVVSGQHSRRPASRSRWSTRARSAT
jgi:transposase